MHEHVELVGQTVRDTREVRQAGRVANDAPLGRRGVAAPVRASATSTRPMRRPERRCASAVGSLTGSLANGVRRFSRLFLDQVCADPDAVTIVPKRGLAMTFVHGIGVSASPSSTMA